MKVEVAVEGDRIGNRSANENQGSVSTSTKGERRFGRIDRPDEPAGGKDTHARVAGQAIVSELRRVALAVEHLVAAQAEARRLVVELQIFTVGDGNRIRRR